MVLAFYYIFLFSASDGRVREALLVLRLKLKENTYILRPEDNRCIYLKITPVQSKLQVCNSDITKTYLYNFDPFKPHFYIVKLGLYIIFVISAQNIDCGYSLEPPRRSGSNEYPQSMF